MKLYLVIFTLLAILNKGNAYIQYQCVNKPEYDIQIKWEVGANEPSYFPAPQAKKCFTFQVKAPKFIEISFHNEHQKTKTKYIYVDLGYNNEKDSAIVVHGKPYSVVDATNFLSAQEYRGFWITWYNGYIQVGKEHSIDPFMSENFEKELNFKWIGFRLEYAAKGGSFLKIPKCHKCNNMTSFIEWPERLEFEEPSLTVN